MSRLLSALADLLFGWRTSRIQREQQRLLRHKERLLRQLASHELDAVSAAIEELRARGWLYDGSLKAVDLDGANLYAARLDGASLPWANLDRADLRNASLRGADLRGASLRGADLRGADLDFADLQGATLQWANLGGARLLGANLQGTRLWDADLQDARLENARFDEYTALPDHTLWTPNTGLGHFTDPENPDFWRPLPYRLTRPPRWTGKHSPDETTSAP